MNKQRCRWPQWPQQMRPREESAAPVHADHVTARGEQTNISADQIGF